MHGCGRTGVLGRHAVTTVKRYALALVSIRLSTNLTSRKMTRRANLT